MLTEALIRELLRAGKLQQAEEEETPPRRGRASAARTGRFRGPAKQKARPVVPAGVQTHFKKGPGPTKPRAARSEGD